MQPGHNSDTPEADVTPSALTGQALPGPPSRWPLGATEIMQDWLGTMTRWPRVYGDVYRFRLGFYRLAHVSGAANIEEVLLTKARNFRKGVFERDARIVLGNGLLISEGEFWKRQRRLMSPPFHTKALGAYEGAMVSIADRVSQGWSDGEVRDVFKDTNRMALSIAARTMFDADVEKEAEDLGRTITDFMEGLRVRQDSVVMLPYYLPTPNNRRLRAAVARFDKAIYRFIADRRAHPDEQRADLLSLLLAAQDEDGKGMTDKQLRDESMTLLMAGHETTAASLAATLHFVGAHPLVQEQLQAEVDRVLGGRRPVGADLPALAYTERVVKEGLRLFPPGPIFDRDALEDVEIGGRIIPRGTTVLISPYAMHRDARYFREPERFDPDRWGRPECKSLSRYVYFPFGAGPRICIGAAFAMMESVLLLARLAQRFSFTSIPGRDLRPIPGFTMRPTEAALRIQRRGGFAAAAV